MVWMMRISFNRLCVTCPGECRETGVDGSEEKVSREGRGVAGVLFVFRRAPPIRRGGPASPGTLDASIAARPRWN